MFWMWVYVTKSMQYSEFRITFAGVLWAGNILSFTIFKTLSDQDCKIFFSCCRTFAFLYSFFFLLKALTSSKRNFFCAQKEIFLSVIIYKDYLMGIKFNEFFAPHNTFSWKSPSHETKINFNFLPFSIAQCTNKNK